MSVLTQSLKRILNWLQLNQPSFASSLQPGLTHSEIQEKVKNLPFLLPGEFYELYHWRNGVAYGDGDFAVFFPPYTFNSLEEALEQYYGLVKYAKNFAAKNWIDFSEIWNDKWFPIFSFDQEYMCIVGQKENKETSQILYNLKGAGEVSVQYISLTNMMQTIAECYEIGAYYISEYGDLEIDEVRAEEIRFKYNELNEIY